jgi:hypothetical protein
LRGTSGPASRNPLEKKRKTIDHDYASGKVRGIVHSHCNLVLGNTREDVNVLLGAVRYLRKHHGKDTHRLKCLDLDKGHADFLEVLI